MPLNSLTLHQPNGTYQTHPLPYRDALLHLHRDHRTLRVETQQDTAQITVHPSADGVQLRIENRMYELTLPPDHLLHLRTADGHDRVFVETTMTSQVVIETGRGDDEITLHGNAPGAGRVMVDAGPGNDRINTRDLLQAELDGGQGDDVIVSDAAHATLYAGDGRDHVKVEAGKAIIEALQGDNQLSDGPLDDRIYGRASTITAVDGYSAPLLHEPGALPAEFRATLDVRGEADYVEKVQRQLDMLRASPAASVLLHDLVARNARITVQNSPELDNAAAEYDPAMGDPKVRNGQRGDCILKVRIHYNPLAQRANTPSLVMLYHELCHAWNFASGSVLGDGELQAVGLSAGHMRFDFDDDPHTPDLDSNPAPFNENALRYELGLPPRLSYP